MANRAVKVSSVATVRLVVEVLLTDSWGGDCSVDQIDAQARRGAEGWIEKMARDSAGRIRIVDAPVIVTITSKVEPR